MREAECRDLAEMTLTVLRNLDDQDVISRTRDQVREMASQFAVP
jgi:glycine/serine hydroxymethyltransferase